MSASWKIQGIFNADAKDMNDMIESERLNQGLAEVSMCGEFKCVHQQCDICNFDDRECEGDSCINWNDCGSCAYGGTGCTTEY